MALEHIPSKVFKNQRQLAAGLHQWPRRVRECKKSSLAVRWAAALKWCEPVVAGTLKCSACKTGTGIACVNSMGDCTPDQDKTAPDLQNSTGPGGACVF